LQTHQSVQNFRLKNIPLLICLNSLPTSQVGWFNWKRKGVKRVIGLLSTRGRIGRLCYFGLSLILKFVDYMSWIIALGVPCLLNITSKSFLCTGLWLFGSFMVETIVLCTIYIKIVTIVKRLHDINMSGWHLVWIFLCVSIFEHFIGWPAGKFPLSTVWKHVAVMSLVACLVIYIAICIVLMFKSGTKGPNRFGERATTFRELFRKPI
jgi:uncharacterized membrane protein YhaH (DUF805 family)